MIGIEEMNALIDKFHKGDWVLSDKDGIGIITYICTDKKDENYTSCFVLFLKQFKHECGYYTSYCFLSNLTKLKQKESVSILDLFDKV